MGAQHFPAEVLNGYASSDHSLVTLFLPCYLARITERERRFVVDGLAGEDWQDRDKRLNLLLCEEFHPRLFSGRGKGANLSHCIRTVFEHASELFLTTEEGPNRTIFASELFLHQNYFRTCIRTVFRTAAKPTQGRDPLEAFLQENVTHEKMDALSNIMEKGDERRANTLTARSSRGGWRTHLENTSRSDARSLFAFLEREGGPNPANSLPMHYGVELW